MRRWVIIFIILIGNQTINAQSYLDFHFKSRNVKGGIVIQNDDASYFAVSDEYEGNKPSAPTAIFHLFSYVMSLQYFPEYHHSKLLWDGVNRDFFGENRDSWSTDMDANEAFKTKNDYFFQTVFSKIDQQHIVENLKLCQFTNAKWLSEIPYNWQFGTLKLTPEQAIQFLKKLNKLQLPFLTQNQIELKNLLKINSNQKLALYGIDGFTIENGERIEWFLGFIEKNNKTYYFSTRTYLSVEKEYSAEFSKQKFIITSEILETLNLL